METLSEFSFFNGPITNKWPRKNVTVPDIYRGLTSTHYQDKTNQLRFAIEPDEKRNIKKSLDYVTFAGTFICRDKENLLNYSGFSCIDFDHVPDTQIEVIKELLINDKMLETQLLFLSPSGSGLKWIVEIDIERFPDYEINFKGIVFYLRKTYPEYFNTGANIIDETGKDVCRACFLCYDPKAYINPKYL